jgi:hypothetical protein
LFPAEGQFDRVIQAIAEMDLQEVDSGRNAGSSEPIEK